jgi:phage-related protein
MKQLPSALIIEKNRLGSEFPWLILLTITLRNSDDPNDTTIVQLVRNTENVSYQGDVYTAFPFSLDATRLSSKGEIPTLTLSVSNVTRVLQADMEAFNGGLGSTIRITVVNANHLAEDCAELEMEFDVLSCSATAEVLALSLGAPNPLRRRFPLDRYLCGHCSWPFRGAECGYAVVDSETCNRTLARCRELGQAGRFGGFTGLRPGALRVV